MQDYARDINPQPDLKGLTEDDDVAARRGEPDYAEIENSGCDRGADLAGQVACGLRAHPPARARSPQGSHSIGTWPSSAATRSSHANTFGYRAMS